MRRNIPKVSLGPLVVVGLAQVSPGFLGFYVLLSERMSLDYVATSRVNRLATAWSTVS